MPEQQSDIPANAPWWVTFGYHFGYPAMITGVVAMALWQVLNGVNVHIAHIELVLDRRDAMFAELIGYQKTEASELAALKTQNNEMGRRLDDIYRHESKDSSDGAEHRQ